MCVCVDEESKYDRIKIFLKIVCLGRMGTKPLLVSFILFNSLLHTNHYPFNIGIITNHLTSNTVDGWLTVKE